MSVGLYDADLQYYPIPFYNLELMKYATYYKRKREIVGFSPDFSPHMYNTFIVRQDFQSPFIYPANVDNLVYGGRAFDGGKYEPLPLDIEIMRPDISLYSKVKPNKKTGYSPSALSTMQRAEHIRLSLDGATIWDKFEKQLRKESNAFGIIFHDYDLARIENSLDTIKQLLPKAISNPLGRRVGMKFPVQIYNENNLLQWLQLQPMGTYYSLNYNGLITNELAQEILKIDSISKAYLQMSVNINSILQQDKSIDQIIHTIFRNIINLRTQHLVFPLIYDEDIFSDYNWKTVMRLINRYNIHIYSESRTSDYFKRIEPYETLYSYAKGAIKQYHINESLLSKESITNIFQFVRENNYDLFKDFYEYRGGEIRNDRN